MVGGDAYAIAPMKELIKNQIDETVKLKFENAKLADQLKKYQKYYQKKTAMKFRNSCCQTDFVLGTTKNEQFKSKLKLVKV